MTTAKSSATHPGTPRGRGLDALFESTATPAPSSEEIEAELAALLDNEVKAAVGSVEAASARPARRTPAAAPSVEEAIDVPPTAAEAQPATPSPKAAAPADGAPAAAETPPPPPERPAAITKRFGAIIMETTPTEPAPEESTPEVGPAGEIIEEKPVPAVTAAGAQPERALAPAAAPSAAPPGPGVTQPGSPSPIVITPRPGDQREAMLAQLDKVLGAGWQKALHRQIDELYKQVAVEFSSPPENAERALSLLKEARQILTETPEEYVSVEYRIAQVQSRLNRQRESRKQSRYYGPRILLYETGWIVLLLLGLVFASPLATWIGRIGSMSGDTLRDVLPIWQTMMWGGIGGVIGALYSLWYHVSDQQDFDRQYMMWYLVQPIMGLVLGGIVFLLLGGGFLILQVDLTDPKATTAARLLPYLVAVLGGFRQNFIYGQFDRLIGLFTPGTQKSEAGEGK